MVNSRYYDNGTLVITLDDYIKVFTAVKRELDLNSPDNSEGDTEGDHRYDEVIELAIADNVYRIAKEELWPNQNLSTTFTTTEGSDLPGFFNIELTAISHIFNVSLLDGDGNVITGCVPRRDSSCCGSEGDCLSYTIEGNYLKFNNSEKLDPNTRYAIRLLTNGGNLDYWFRRGWRLLTQAVKCDIYLNYMKDIDAYTACFNNYMLLYRDLEKQSYDLADLRIKPNRSYW